MKRILAVLLTLALALSLTACGSNIDGRYNISEMSAGGLTMNYADLALSGMHESYIDFDKDSATISIAGEGILKLTVNFDDNTLIDPDDAENNTTFSISEDGQTITVANPAMDDSDLVFVIEDSPLWEEIQKQESSMLDQVLGDNDIDLDDLSDEDMDVPGSDADGDIDAPDSDADEEDDLDDQSDNSSFTSETTHFEVDTVWYGFMDIMNYEGPDDLNGTYDIYGYLGNNGIDDYFELYMEITLDGDPVVTYYIDLYDDYFTPILDEYAYSFGELMGDDDYFGYAAFLDNGFIFLMENYESETESFEVAFGLREYGSAWDTESDYLPPSYDSYLEEIS